MSYPRLGLLKALERAASQEIKTRTPKVVPLKGLLMWPLHSLNGPRYNPLPKGSGDLVSGVKEKSLYFELLTTPIKAFISSLTTFRLNPKP